MAGLCGRSRAAIPNNGTGGTLPRVAVKSASSQGQRLLYQDPVPEQLLKPPSVFV